MLTTGHRRLKALAWGKLNLKGAEVRTRRGYYP